MTTPRRILVAGERLTIAEIAKRAGITPAGVRLRLRAGLRGAELVAAPLPRGERAERRGPTYDVGGGRRLMVREIVALTGIDKGTIRGRVARGLRGPELLRAPERVRIAIAPAVLEQLDAYAGRLGVGRDEALRRALVQAASSEPIAAATQASRSP
jgi:hypothetical protein